MKRWHVDNLTDSDGFTLIELLVVVVMVGILASIAAPGWLGFVQRQRADAVRSDLLGALRTAQSEAMSKQENREVMFSSTALSVTVRPEIASTGGTVVTLGNEDARGKVSIAASTSLTFNHDGAVNVTTPFIIDISHSNSTIERCVIVTTLLGGLKPESDDTCNNFASTP